MSNYNLDEFFDSVGSAPKPNNKRTSSKDQGGIALAIEDDEGMDFGGSSCWGAVDNWIYHGVSKTVAHLPCGLYAGNVTQEKGPILLKQKIDTDDIIEFSDSQSLEVIKEIDEFSKLKPEFTKRGFLYKRGLLLWGPPGSGKTCTLQLLIKKIIEDLNGIAIQVANPHIAAACLQLVRQIEPDRQIIAILEDMDALVMRYGESEFLALMDGETQVDNIVYVATTNYPENLDKRFVDRPSRFDTITYVGMPSEKARYEYFKLKEPNLGEDTLKKYVELSKGFSIAHLKEMIIMTQCFKRPIEEVAAKLEKMVGKRPTSDDSPEKPQFGFASGH